MNWLAWLLGDEGKGISQFSLATVLVGVLIKYGDKILTFVLNTLGIHGERRWNTEVNLQKQVDDLNDRLIVTSGAVLLVCEAYETNNKATKLGAQSLRKHLEKNACLDDMAIFILDQFESLPTLKELRERQGNFPGRDFSVEAREEAKGERDGEGPGK